MDAILFSGAGVYSSGRVYSLILAPYQVSENRSINNVEVYSPRVYASANKTYANAFPWSPAQPGLYVNPITKQLMENELNKSLFFLHKDESISFMWMRFCSRGLGFIVPAESTVWFWHRTKFRKIDRLIINVEVYSPRAYASAKKTYANAFPWSPAQPGLYVNPITKQLMEKWIKQIVVFPL